MSERIFEIASCEFFSSAIARFVNEKLGEHWCVDESKESFEKLMNHLKKTTNMYKFFSKAAESIFKILKKDKLKIADIGGGIGWTSCLLAQSSQVEFFVQAVYLQLDVLENCSFTHL